MSLLIDHKQRLDAIDPRNSYIVQAPAGSGKTELLSQRYLTLLALVENPEEILALTFTKKAAAEMRERILHSLQKASLPFQGQTAHEKQGYYLAQKALAQDEKQGWQLCKNPNRMRIQTIDSLAAKISKTRPILNKGFSHYNLTDNPDELYQTAARNVIEYINDNDQDWQQSIYNIIEYLDVNLLKLEQLLVRILSRREQWLPYLLTDQLETQIINAIQQCQQQTLQKLNSIDDSILKQWLEVGLYTERQLEQDEITLNQKHLLEFASNSLSSWKKLTQLVLTKDNKIRKRLDKNLGFPSPSGTKDKHEKEERNIFKDKMAEVIGFLTENKQHLSLFIEILALPTAEDFNDDIKKVLSALQEILPLLTAELQIIFEKNRTIDFNELTTLAKSALCQDHAPTDLQLKLDYQIKHILVDEFQDTSISQYSLLSNLIAGWENTDGRTLFFVGDPMQSIYRFRQAEVGLFLKVQQGLMGSLSINPIHLQANFRSSPDIIHWVNHTFHNIFPEQAISHLGAVPYSQSEPQRDFSGTVHGNLFLHADSEATGICDYIKEKIKEQKTIAILVRSRNHLATVTNHLRAYDIPYNATELDLLIDSSLCLDLLTITEVLCKPHERLGWLSLFRSPFCGLDLKSIETLVENADLNFINTIKANHQKLTPSYQARIEKCLTIMGSALELVKKLPLSEIVHHVWKSFLGDKILKSPVKDLKVAEKYFNLLDKYAKFYINDFNYFIETLHTTRIDENQGADCLVNIMTIHKSKGLEFDVVILPQLHRKPNNNQSELIQWSEFTDDTGTPHFLLAPIKNSSSTALHDYLQYLNKSKEHFESQRLLYVACTRAKKELFLTGIVELNDNNVIKPPSNNTLLSMLWEHVAFELKQDKSYNHSEEEINYEDNLKFIPEKFYKGLNDNLLKKYHLLLEQRVVIDLNHDWKVQTGTLIHAVFAELLINPTHVINNNLIEKLLYEYNINPKDHEKSTETINKAIRNLQHGKHSAWLLGDHPKKNTEYEILTFKDNELNKRSIDLTFIDKKNIRWIIDHKVVFHDTPDPKKLINKYKEQLSGYEQCFQKMENNLIKKALYLPLQDTLIGVS